MRICRYCWLQSLERHPSCRSRRAAVLFNLDREREREVGKVPCFTLISGAACAFRMPQLVPNAKPRTRLQPETHAGGSRISNPPAPVFLPVLRAQTNFALYKESRIEALESGTSTCLIWAIRRMCNTPAMPVRACRDDTVTHG